VHRIGRTGRAGNVGRAVSLVCSDEYPLLKDIERLLNQTLTKNVIPGYEPTALVPKEKEKEEVQPKGKRSNQRRSNWAKSPTQSTPSPIKKPAKAGTAPKKRLRAV